MSGASVTCLACFARGICEAHGMTDRRRVMEYLDDPRRTADEADAILALVQADMRRKFDALEASTIKRRKARRRAP